MNLVFGHVHLDGVDDLWNIVAQYTRFAFSKLKSADSSNANSRTQFQDPLVLELVAVIKDVSSQNDPCLPKMKTVVSVGEDGKLVQPQCFALFFVDNEESLGGLQDNFVAVAHGV